MPSFRTIFALVATTFVAFSSAAPIADSTSQATQLVNVNNVANHVASVKVSDINVDAAHVKRHQIGQTAELVNIEDTANNAVHDVNVSGIDAEVLKSHHSIGRREEPKPIVAILLQVKAELEATSGKLDTTVKGKAEVNLDDLKVILDELRTTLTGAVASVQLIVGQSAAFIFTYNGKLWTAAQVGTLLISVVVNVFHILSVVLRVVVSASHKAALAEVGVSVDVLAKLLVAIFVKLDVGIFTATRPQLTGALFKAWASLHLDAIVAILKNGTA